VRGDSGTSEFDTDDEKNGVQVYHTSRTTHTVPREAAHEYAEAADLTKTTDTMTAVGSQLEGLKVAVPCSSSSRYQNRSIPRGRVTGNVVPAMRTHDGLHDSRNAIFSPP